MQYLCVISYTTHGSFARSRILGDASHVAWKRLYAASNRLIACFLVHLRPMRSRAGFCAMSPDPVVVPCNSCRADDGLCRVVPPSLNITKSVSRVRFCLHMLYHTEKPHCLRGFDADASSEIAHVRR